MWTAMLLAAVSCLPLTTSVEQTQPIFLLAATDRVISSLSPGNATEVSKHDDLGALLRDICDAARRAVVVVGCLLYTSPSPRDRG